MWCWRRVPWTARRSNQSILKETSPGCSLEGLMLKLKLQYFGHLMRRADSLEKTLMLGKIEGRLRKGGDKVWDGWMASPTQWAWVWVDSGSWWWTGRPGMLRFMGSQRVGHNWLTELNINSEKQNISPRIRNNTRMPTLITLTCDERKRRDEPESTAMCCAIYVFPFLFSWIRWMHLKSRRWVKGWSPRRKKFQKMISRVK